MDDLIILIIQAIAKMLKVESPKAPPRRTGSPAVSPPPIVLRRKGPLRRPAPPPIPAGRKPIAPARPTVVVEEKVVPGSAGSHTILNPVTKSADAAVSIRALLTPSTLQKQFILTEIFQPPIALRDPR
jgi:hypothetical protein